MFRDVQRLKVAEANAALERVKNEEAEMHDEVRALKDQLYSLEIRLQRMQDAEKRGMDEFRGKKFSAWERLLTKRKAYQVYQNALGALKKLPNEIAALSSEIEIAEMQTADQVARSGILSRITDAENQLFHVERATTLAELNLTPDEAVKLLKNNEITPVLDESDYTVFERPREYDTKGKAALMAVHKMEVMPENSRLSTLQEAGVINEEAINIAGRDYHFQYLLERNTMHVSLNDEVSSHMGGNWDDCHYCVLQPLAEIPNAQIASLAPNDTYTRGGIDLTANAWILCPADEVETVQELNPGVHVLGYTAQNVKGLAAPFLSQLGYRAENVGQWGWEDTTSQNQVFQLAEREKLSIVQHCNSQDLENEEFNIAVNRTIAAVKMLVEQGVVRTPEDWERLQPKSTRNINFEVRCPVTLEYVANVVKKMQRAGIPLTPVEQTNLQAKNIITTIVTSALRAHSMQTERTL